ncbi:MAG: zinc ribbon domain-containing protein [Promethearchaeota archaeon]|nr:MAG: zinc ribbon domain-containing protein [Candidatus Lokiarchaeota archaeon]
MTERGFEPLTSQLGVPGTSYRLQLGLINEKWAVRLLKGKEVMDSYIFRDEDVQGDFPNQNLIVGWVLRTVAIPNINPHQVMKTTQALVKQALQKKTQKKVVAPISETKEIELETIPESELKRPKVQGWVKTEGIKTQEGFEEEKRQAFKERVAARKEEGIAGVSSVSTIKTTRELPSIPKVGVEENKKADSEGEFCPYCGKDLGFRFCPFCGKPLPHD